MESGTDVFATLTWGLRRYAVLILALVLALGVLVPLALSNREEVFEATAQVGPSKALELPNADPLPRIAQSIFNNGAVEQAVRALLQQPTGNIIPSKVQLVAAQDNLVLAVVAHAPTAAQAMSIANDAARTFVLELNNYEDSVSTFVVQHSATLAKKSPKFAGGYASIGLGLLAGLLAGIALVGLLLVFRRPVVEGATAQEATGAPLIGRIRLPRHGPPREADGRAIALLCRRLVTASARTVHVTAPSHRQAEQLAASMREVFQQMRTGLPQGESGSVVPLPKVLGPDEEEAWLVGPDDASYTVLMAPEGISARKLRLFAEGHATGDGTGVVLVTPRRGLRLNPFARR